MTVYKIQNGKKRDGTASFRVTWFDKGHRHRCRTFESAAERLAFVREMKQEDAAKRAVERTARRSGDYVARFSRLDTETQNLLLGALDAVTAAGGRAEDVREAVERHVAGMGGGHTVEEAVATHLADVERLRRFKTFKNRRLYLKPFRETFGELQLGRLSRSDCQGWILEEGITVGKSVQRHKALSALLRWAWRREWLRTNPMDGLERPRSERREEVRIFTADEAERLLRAAEEVAPRMVPFFAIGLFCGLRPEKELTGLEGRDVDLEGGEIYVRWKLTKTMHERTVPVSDNLKAWLKRYPPGEKVVWSRTAHRRAVAEAGLTWTPDVMRHTRASFRLAQTRDPIRTADEMGHDVSTLKRYYANRRIPVAEVEKFWGIVPREREGGDETTKRRRDETGGRDDGETSEKGGPATARQNTDGRS